jgi:hypothetical protein
MSETITRACGCIVSFTPKGDPYDDARRDKLQRKRCPACGLVKNAEDNTRQQLGGGRKLKKSRDIKLLPAMTQILLERQPGDLWAGSLSAGLVTVHASQRGVMGLLAKLARRWHQERGATLEGKVAQ